jgi:NADH:ubiquinone oxidoreductase subunit E
MEQTMLAALKDKKPELLLGILRQIEEEMGYLTPRALSSVAKRLHIPPRQLWEVASFYSLYHLSPPGRHLIRICRSAPCHVRGAGVVLAALERELGIRPGQTTADGFFTIEEVSCLGLCSVAPAMMIGDLVWGKLTRERVAEIIRKYYKSVD